MYNNLTVNTSEAKYNISICLIEHRKELREREREREKEKEKEKENRRIKEKRKKGRNGESNKKGRHTDINKYYLLHIALLLLTVKLLYEFRYFVYYKISKFVSIS